MKTIMEKIMPVLAAVFASAVAKRIIVGVFEILAKNTETEVDDNLVALVKEALGEK